MESEAKEQQPTLSSSTSSPPTNNGNALNPDAYKLWKHKPVEGEPVKPEQCREKLAQLAQNLSMPKQKKPKGEPRNEEEINQWLADFILRKEVMQRVMRGDRLTVEFDEQGQASRVLEDKMNQLRNISENTSNV